MNKTIIIALVIFSMVACKQELESKDSVENHSTELSSNSIELHEHSVEIEGRELKTLTVKKVANLWEIDPENLLSKIIEEFNFSGDYTVNTILEDMRNEYKFSPSIIKDIAESLKTAKNK